MEGIKYANCIEIGLVVIEIQGAENGMLAVPVNNTLVCHTAFLAADTQPCVLISHKFSCRISTVTAHISEHHIISVSYHFYRGLPFLMTIK